MNTELLKKKILQLAMQGKLVKQNENDGTANELIDKILEEKKQLMTEGKIKKEKLSRIYKNPSDNHYYEKFEDGKKKPLKNLMLLPDKWQYIKINDVIFYEQPSKYIVESTNYNDKYNTPVLTAGKSFILGYTNETKGIFSKVPTIIFDDFTTESKFVNFNFKIKSSALKILNCSNLVNIKFIYYLLQVINVDTSTHKRHWLSNYEYMIIPIPSRSEQDKIVIKIEELFEKVKLISDHYDKITKLKNVLKSKIIDIAIRGQLTKQLSTDEPSSKLIENILEEKRKLIKERKIKKENLSVIYKDSTDNQFYEKFDDGKKINVNKEIPYNLPSNWEWIKLKTIAFVTKLAGFEYTKNIQPNLSKKGIPLFKGKNVQNGELVLNFESYIPEEVSDKLSRSQLIKKCLLTPYVGTIGNIAIFDGSFRAHLGSNVGKIELYGKIMEEYILYYLRSTTGNNQLKKYKKSTAQESISIDAIRECYIALPPTEEQIRIVKAIKLISEKL